jgi:hypothetical protein
VDQLLAAWVEADNLARAAERAAVVAQNYAAAVDRAAQESFAAAENLAVEQSFVAAGAAQYSVVDNSVAVQHLPGAQNFVAAAQNSVVVDSD